MEVIQNSTDETLYAHKQYKHDDTMLKQLVACSHVCWILKAQCYESMCKGEPKDTPEIELGYLANISMMFRPETSDDIDLYLFSGLFQGR